MNLKLCRDKQYPLLAHMEIMYCMKNYYFVEEIVWSTFARISQTGYVYNFQSPLLTLIYTIHQNYESNQYV